MSLILLQSQVALCLQYVLELAGDDDPFVVTHNVKPRADNASQINDLRSLVESADSEEE